MTTLREEIREGAAWITFDRPERLNSWRGPEYGDLRAALERALGDDDVRAIVLTGAGRAFSAGADRSLIDGSATEEERRRAGEELDALLAAMDRCDKPLLAAVNGLAVGIGATMLLHCDLVVMARSARLRFPFTALGLLPEAGSSYLLPARARWDESLWAMLSSEWIDADTAQRMGLAWRVTADSSLVVEVATAVAVLAGLDPASVAGTKRLLMEGRAALIADAVRREYAEWRQLPSRRPDPPRF